jgi:hypothetical protein
MILSNHFNYKQTYLTYFQLLEDICNLEHDKIAFNNYKANKHNKINKGTLGCSTILCLTIQMDLVKCCFGLRSTNRT